jgi:hypothetical protein
MFCQSEVVEKGEADELTEEMDAMDPPSKECR